MSTKRSTAALRLSSPTAQILEYCRQANELAREARLGCTDVIRQTQLKPYYGMRGGAAFLAPQSHSEAQLERMASAVQKMRAAAEAIAQAEDMLHDAAIEGNLTQAKIEDITKDDPTADSCEIITDEFTGTPEVMTAAAYRYRKQK